MSLTRAVLLHFMRQHHLVVESSVAANGNPQAAVVGVAVTDDFEIVFDTVDTTRKAVNLTHNPHIALVIGGTAAGSEKTVQYEGVAQRLKGAELARYQAIYLNVFPDGRERLSWPGLIYVRVTPQWLRYSNFGTTPPTIVEFDAAGLKALR